MNGLFWDNSPAGDAVVHAATLIAAFGDS